MAGRTPVRTVGGGKIRKEDAEEVGRHAGLGPFHMLDAIAEADVQAAG